MPKLDPPSKTYVHIPETVSQEAQAFLRTLQDPALMPAFPEPDDLAGWEKVRAHAEADAKAKSAPLLQRYEHTVTAESLGGVPVLDVRPKNWKDNGKVAVYTHGGAHVMNSAASMLGRAVVFAHETGLRVLSVDYTLAPLAKYNQMSDEVIRAIGALLKKGQRLADTAIYGDSSGGGLAAAVVLKMRDQGLGMPAAAVLVISKGFPPTLIQGGLKETLLSGFVRFYQALDAAGVPVKLDLYEGMIHNFQDRIPDAPEAILARRKIRMFLQQHLGM